MNILKCDRCGKEEDVSRERLVTSPAPVTLWGAVVARALQGGKMLQSQWDLCPSCIRHVLADLEESAKELQPKMPEGKAAIKEIPK